MNWCAMGRKLRRRRRPKRSAPPQVKWSGSRTLLLEALHISGYVKPIAVTSTEERVRRMVRRMTLSSRDAELWLGMLRQILWKMRAKAGLKK